MAGKNNQHQYAARRSVGNQLLQDIGMLVFLLCVFAGGVLSSFLTSDRRIEFIIMLLVSFFSVLLAGFRLGTLSVIIASLLTVVYTSYKLYMNLTMGSMINALDFMWLFYPLLSVSAMNLFISRTKKVEDENEKLHQQIEDLVLVDANTGLNNLKSLYLDLKIQTSLVMRGYFELTLMIIAFKYEEEIRKILGDQRVEELQKLISEKVVDMLRTGDRVYVVDEMGTLAASLVCGSAGAQIIKNRIKAELQTTDAFPGFHDRYSLRLDLQIAFIQYDKDIHGTDMVAYKKKVESELQYDV